MSNVTSQYTSTYTSFSGCDIVATFGAKVIGELQGITYHVQREKAPIYTMGSPEPRSFSRGKRGVAGSLVFTVFDRDALIAGLQEHIKTNNSLYRIGGYNAEYTPMTIDEWDTLLTQQATGTVSASGGADTETATKLTNALHASNQTPVYADEIPPFDITISFMNEYGQKAVIVIYAVEILNESSGFSIDNVVSEKACTFVARRVEYMKPIDSNGNIVEDFSATSSL